jgi:archaellum component FlaC
MGNDRLADLRRFQERTESGALEKTAPEPDALIVDIREEETGITNLMGSFQKQVQSAQGRIDDIASNIKNLKKTYTKSLQVTSQSQQQGSCVFNSVDSYFRD